jgi:hypothetical protein
MKWGWIDIAQRPVADSCENINEFLGFMKFGNFLTISSPD